MENDIQKILDGLKKGKISYKSLTLEQIEFLKQYLQQQINADKETIENIRKKISIHKQKIENM